MVNERITCEFGLNRRTVRRLRTEAERIGLTPSRLVEAALAVYLSGLAGARRATYLAPIPSANGPNDEKEVGVHAATVGDVA